MTDFVDVFPDDELMDALGDDISYSPQAGGGPYAIKAVVELNLERVGSDGFSTERRHEIEFLKAAIPVAPKRGDTLTHNAITYKVDAPVLEDSAYVRLAVR